MGRSAAGVARRRVFARERYHRQKAANPGFLSMRAAEQRARRSTADGANKHRAAAYRYFLKAKTDPVWRSNRKERMRLFMRAKRSQIDPRQNTRVFFAKRCRGLGVSEEDVARIELAQQRRCAICRDAPAAGLCIDHSHSTGKVRGLLCRNCNSLLGYARDMVSRLQWAIGYLMTHEGYK